mmetsp:Transcript_61344/g.146113  ORF Transcript_61344/g.146113 Transcript_61344/m.146113 type:complete len:221 (+) Transcript_61344:199-861(+)
MLGAKQLRFETTCRLSVPGPARTGEPWSADSLHPAAPSSKGQAEVVAAGGAPRPPSRARAHASHAPAVTQCAAARSAAIAARCGLPSWQSCPRCCGNADCTSASKLCPRGRTCSQRTPPSPEVQHQPRSDPPPLRRQIVDLGRRPQPGQTSRLPSSRRLCNASSPQMASRLPSYRAHHARRPSVPSSSAHPYCVASPSCAWSRCSSGGLPHARHSLRSSH